MIESIGLVYADQNQLDTALSYFFQAIQMFRRALPDQHPHTGLCLGKI